MVRANFHATVADADPQNWIDSFAPEPLKPYLRLMRADRFTGVWLLVLPCWFAIALAAATSDVSLAMATELGVLFFLFSFVMRGAGCVYNDIIDQDFDRRVARTASRPLPSGQVTTFQAWVLFFSLIAIAFSILAVLNPFTIKLIVLSLFMIAAYPFAKRVTWKPQIWLGLTFNWMILIGYASVTGDLSLASLLLYAAGVFWTVGYDTIYALQDKDDDKLIGVKSTALYWGDHVKTAVSYCYLGTMVLMSAVGIAAGFGIIFQMLLIPAGLHFLWQILSIEPDNRGQSLYLFRCNKDAGFLLFLPILIQMFFERAPF